MQVNSTTSTSTSSSNSTSTSSAAASATIDYNSFLKLLIAQLKNQDPTQFMSQLASFSAVGQTIQTNQKLDTMLTTSALAQADATIGRTVTSSDGKISGKVKSVAIGSDGTVTATLEGGNTLALGSGVTVS